MSGHFLPRIVTSLPFENELANDENGLSLVSPPMNNFDPKDYVMQWFRKGHGDASFINCEAGATSKSINQNKIYFRRYFKSPNF